VAFIAVLTPLTTMAQRAKADSRPVAIVTEVHGNVWAETAGPGKQEARTFDWFSAGAVLSTDAGATMVVVFESGKRTRLGERSRIRVTADGPADARGITEPLTPVPPLPHVSVVTLEGPATRINAVRVRGDAFARLHPDGSALIADQARLQFEPVREFSSYAITIEREDGTLAFDTTTSATSIDVRPGVLQPGTQYYWRVAAQDPLGRVVRGTGRFVTLTSEQVTRREELRRHLGSSPADLALLAEVDRSLGLVREALPR